MRTDFDFRWARAVGKEADLSGPGLYLPPELCLGCFRLQTFQNGIKVLSELEPAFVIWKRASFLGEIMSNDFLSRMEGDRRWCGVAMGLVGVEILIEM